MIECISIVVPCYNEEGNIPELVRGLTEVLGEYDCDHELILIDDGSQDGTFTTIENEAKTSNRVKGLSLSRNFGHQVALFAGLELAVGDVIITMLSLIHI